MGEAIKVEIIEKFLALRERGNNRDYILLQEFILNGLSIKYEVGILSKEIHHNDRVRLFGILMTITENREYFQILAKDPTS